MEYTREYKVKQDLSTRTYAQLLKTTINLKNDYPEISIKIKNDAEPNLIELSNTDIIGLLHNKISGHTKIEVMVSGYPENILKKCADDIVNIMDEDYKAYKHKKEPSYSFA